MISYEYDTELPGDSPRMNRGRFVVGGAYRYCFDNGLGLGAKYMYSPPYRKFSGSTQYQAHTLTFSGEYRFRREKEVSPFVGLGAGPQYVYARNPSWENWDGTRMGVLWEAGVEIRSKVRVSLGHYNHGANFWDGTYEPFMFLTLGWLF